MAILLIAAPLALLVVYAGIKLLIQTKREVLGHLYKCASWFFIIAGLLTLACIGACGIAMCCKYGMGMMHKKNKMMHEYYHGDMHEHMGWDHHKKMMKHFCKDEEGCAININCCGRDIEKCCSYTDVCKPDTMRCKK